VPVGLFCALYGPFLGLFKHLCIPQVSDHWIQRDAGRHGTPLYCQDRVV